MDLHNKDYLKDVSVDIDHQRALTQFLDAGKSFPPFPDIFFHLCIRSGDQNGRWY